MSHILPAKRIATDDNNEADLVKQMLTCTGQSSSSVRKSYSCPRLYQLANLLSVTLGGSPGITDSYGNGCVPGEDPCS
jgi:hypothetical protein